MTARQLFENALIELSKVKAPSLLLEDFNYLINKAIYLYVNKRYNIYDTSQQTTDDLRVLKSTALLEPTLSTLYNPISQNGTSPLSLYKNSVSNIYGNIYEVDLPYDYFHMLNCICIYKINKKHKCYPAGSYMLFAASKLDSDKWSQIIGDYYNRPTPLRPYYFLHNVNVSNSEYTNPINSHIGEDEEENIILNPQGTDQTIIDGIQYSDLHYQIWETNIGLKVKVHFYGLTKIYAEFIEDRLNKLLKTSGNKGYNIENNKLKQSDSYLYYNTTTNSLHILDEKKDEHLKLVELTVPSSESYFDRSILLPASENSSDAVQYIDLVDKPAGSRHANQSKVRCEIRYGKDNSIFELVGVSIDYIKSPLFVELTPELMDLTEDTSLILEFPDYVCQEIINELVHVIMENTADPRLLTHSVISLSIASPTQQLAAQPAATAAQ